MAATHTAERYSWRVADLREEIIKDIESFFKGEGFGISVEYGYISIRSGTLTVVKIEKEYCVVDEIGILAIHYNDEDTSLQELIKILEFLQSKIN
jgi:hypothetical protein